MVHCRSLTEALKLRWIEGRATFTIVTSIPTMNRLMQQIASTSLGRTGPLMLVDIQPLYTYN